MDHYKPSHLDIQFAILFTFFSGLCSNNQSLILHVVASKNWGANSLDPDQIPQSVASGLGLHCLLSSVIPNTKGLMLWYHLLICLKTAEWISNRVHPDYIPHYTEYLGILQCHMLLCLKTAGRVANSVDPDQMPHSAASDLGLPSLLRPICPNT